MSIQEQILKDVTSLKPLSQSTVLLTSIIQNPDYRSTEIVKVVEHDPVLTASVLRIVNSAAFARRFPIDNIQQAVPLLGERMILGIAFGLCSSHLFNDPLEGYETESGGMWQHSLLTAIGAKEVARFAKVQVRPELVFTAGLVHDLGKIVLSSYLKGRTTETVIAVEQGDVEDYIAAERKLLGTDHSKVGHQLSTHWSLPPALQEVMAHHHRPAESLPEFRSLTYTVHIGDFIAMMIGNSGGADHFLYNLDPSYKDYISLSKRDLEKVLLNTQMELEKTLEALYLGAED